MAEALSTRDLKERHVTGGGARGEAAAGVERQAADGAGDSEHAPPRPDVEDVRVVPPGRREIVVPTEGHAQEAIGMRIPPAKPCKPRMTIIEPRSCVKAQPIENSANRTLFVSMKRRTENTRLR